MLPAPSHRCTPDRPLPLSALRQQPWSRLTRSASAAPVSTAAPATITGSGSLASAPHARARVTAVHSAAAPSSVSTDSRTSPSAYEGNAANLVAALRSWRAREGENAREQQGGGEASRDSEAAAAGGVIAALELGYQEAKQGAWMARGFVTAFLDAGGAEELLAVLRDGHRDVALQAFELTQALIEQHPAARSALLQADVVKELVRVLGSPTASRRVRFDCVMLLSDLLESAITTDARQSAGEEPTGAAGVARQMAEDGVLRHIVQRLRSSDPSARAMAARLIGLIASRGDDLRAQLLAAGALDGLMTALGAMDAVASVGGPLPGGKSAAGGLVPAFTVHHELGMQHQIATGLLHLCSVAGATAQQPEPAAAASPAATSSSRHETGGKEADHAAHGQHESAALRGERLVGELVGAGAVPPLLRLRGLGFPRPLREGARRALAPMVAVRGDEVRAIAATVAVPQPRDTPPAAWQAWRCELDEDLGL